MRAETRPVRMGRIEKIVHAFLIVGTAGIWLPVYWAFNSRFKHSTVTTWDAQ